MVREKAKKNPAWIFDSIGGRRSGLLEIREDASEGLRPNDKTWRYLTTFPVAASAGDTVRIVVWADSADKYIARVDIADTHRWMIMEATPVFLANVEAFNALVQLGRGGKN